MHAVGRRFEPVHLQMRDLEKETAEKAKTAKIFYNMVKPLKRIKV